MKNPSGLQLQKDLHSPISFARLMFSRSGLLSRAAQATVGGVTRALIVVGLYSLGDLVRTKRVAARSRYQRACDSMLHDAVASGFFDTYVDLGAHRGEQVLEVAKHLTVIAFEPDPRVFGTLVENVEKSLDLRTADVRLFQMAVSDFNGRTNLSFSDSDHGKTGGSTIETSKLDYSHLQYVEVETIDVLDVLKLLKDARKAILKMDIEGAEYRVLKRLAKARRLGELGLLLVEFHEKKMKFGVLRGSWLTIYCWFYGFRRSRIFEWY